MQNPYRTGTVAGENRDRMGWEMKDIPISRG